jgi:Chaperone of endosialidase
METLRVPIFILFSFICAGFLSTVHAVSPPPDGGYPGNNTALGASALFSLITGGSNTGLGSQALYSNTTGNYNSADGFRALFNNTNGGQNTATGASSLLNNTTGSSNTANGVNALYSNTTGSNNTAIGARAFFNSGGSRNTAVGSLALYQSGGNDNTAVGFGAALANDSNIDPNHPDPGFFNTAIGSNALARQEGGDYNTAIGASALEGGATIIGGGSYNTAVGFQALVNGNFSGSNVALGAFTGTNVYSADHVVCIGANVAGADVPHTTWIGSVYGVTTQSGVTAPVVVSSAGQLGTVASSERFKKDIATMDKASDAILSLRPVTFHYKTDSSATPQFGLIAEEVAKVNPALVLPDEQGKPYTVRYDAVNAMLLNEFLKEHRKVEEQQATITGLRKELQANAARQQKQIETLTAGLQKVSAQLELLKPAPQTVLSRD